MWRFVGQRSCPLTEEAYAEQLGAVAELLTEWGVAEEARSRRSGRTLPQRIAKPRVRPRRAQARVGIRDCKEFPSVSTVTAHAIMIPLSVQV